MHGLNSCLENFRRQLRAIRFKQDVDFQGLLSGDSAAFVKFYRNLLCDHNTELIKQLLNRGFSLLGTTDYRFMEVLYLIMRDLLCMRPPLTLTQFYSNTFVARKIQMATTLANRINSIVPRQCSVNNNRGETTVNNDKTHNRGLVSGQNQLIVNKHLPLSVSKFSRTTSVNSAMSDQRSGDVCFNGSVSDAFPRKFVGKTKSAGRTSSAHSFTRPAQGTVVSHGLSQNSDRDPFCANKGAACKRLDARTLPIGGRESHFQRHLFSKHNSELPTTQKFESNLPAVAQWNGLRAGKTKTIADPTLHLATHVDCISRNNRSMRGSTLSDVATMNQKPTETTVPRYATWHSNKGELSNDGSQHPIDTINAKNAVLDSPDAVGQILGSIQLLGGKIDRIYTRISNLETRFSALETESMISCQRPYEINPNTTTVFSIDSHSSDSQMSSSGDQQTVVSQYNSCPPLQLSNDSYAVSTANTGSRIPISHLVDADANPSVLVHTQKYSNSCRAEMKPLPFPPVLPWLPEPVLSSQLNSIVSSCSFPLECTTETVTSSWRPPLAPKKHQPNNTTVPLDATTTNVSTAQESELRSHLETHLHFDASSSVDSSVGDKRASTLVPNVQESSDFCLNSIPSSDPDVVNRHSANDDSEKRSPRPYNEQVDRIKLMLAETQVLLESRRNSLVNGVA